MAEHDLPTARARSCRWCAHPFAGHRLSEKRAAGPVPGGTWIDEAEDVRQTRAEDSILHHHPHRWDAGGDAAGGPRLHREEALRRPHDGGVADVGGALHLEKQHEEVAGGAEDDLVGLHHCAEVFGAERHIRALAAAEQVVQVGVVVRGFAL